MSEASSSTLATIADGSNEGIPSFTPNGGGIIYQSIKSTTFEARKAVLASVMGSLPIADNLNKEIALKDVVVQIVEMVNEQTGLFEKQPRVILIDEKGVAYHAISSVLARDLDNMLQLLGEPSGWPAPQKVSVAREGTGNRKFFVLKLV